MELPEVSEPYAKFLGAVSDGPVQLTVRAVLVMLEALPQAHYKAVTEAYAAEAAGDNSQWTKLLDTTYDNIEQLFDHVLSSNSIAKEDYEHYRIPAVLATGAWLMMSDYLGD